MSDDLLSSETYSFEDFISDSFLSWSELDRKSGTRDEREIVVRLWNATWERKVVVVEQSTQGGDHLVSGEILAETDARSSSKGKKDVVSMHRKQAQVPWLKPSLRTELAGVRKAVIASLKPVQIGVHGSSARQVNSCCKSRAEKQQDKHKLAPPMDTLSMVSPIPSGKEGHKRRVSDTVACTNFHS